MIMHYAPCAAPAAVQLPRVSDAAGVIMAPNIRLAQRLALGVPALLLAGLEIGGRNMQAMTGVPASLVFLLQSVPVLILLAVRSTRFFKLISLRGATR